MAITKELVQSVRQRVAANPEAHIAHLAVELNATEAEVITALPLNMRWRAKNSDFSTISQIVSSWDNTITVSTGQPGENRVMPGKKPDVGQLREEDLGYTWFISKPLLGQESHSVQFFNKEGRHLLSIYLGRDKSGNLDAVAREGFEDLRKRFSVKPVPHNRCKGCKNCTCDGKGKGHGHHHHHHHEQQALTPAH